MGWLRKRFGESSTYTGLTVIGSVLTMLGGPESAAAASPWVALAAGILQTMKAEKGTE